MSRIVLSREPVPCSTAFLVLKQNADDPES